MGGNGRQGGDDENGMARDRREYCGGVLFAFIAFGSSVFG
jgi:hypothetical protein